SRMDMQLAEVASEREMLLWRDRLVAKEDHEVFGERAMDLVHLPVRAGFIRDELADVDAADLRADDRGQLLDRDRLVRVLLARAVAVARTLFSGQRAHVGSP